MNLFLLWERRRRINRKHLFGFIKNILKFFFMSISNIKVNLIYCWRCNTTMNATTRRFIAAKIGICLQSVALEFRQSDCSWKINMEIVSQCLNSSNGYVAYAAAIIFYHVIDSSDAIGHFLRCLRQSRTCYSVLLWGHVFGPFVACVQCVACVVGTVTSNRFTQAIFLALRCVRCVQCCVLEIGLQGCEIWFSGSE